MTASSPDDTPANGAALPFQPKPDQLHQMPLFERNDVPRYLFRVYCPNTAGETTDSNIIPPASTCGPEKRQDIFRLQPREAARRLNEHLRWWRSHERECNLISWTRSLLFALQHGLRRHHTDLNKPALSQISLLILDTRDFPRGTFVQDMEIMELFVPHTDSCQPYNLKNLLQLRKSDKGYYFGEYLTQGDMDVKGRCVVTNMQSLIDAGLFELKPELEDKSKWDEWADRVVCLRKPFKTSQDTPTATHTEVRKAITVATACFGAGWDFPVATMLLALKRRKRKDPVIIDGFAAMFAGKY
ncbi:MAG: hypothetical protein Q9201_007726 [Fulgogasparrea decipioides]